MLEKARKLGISGRRRHFQRRKDANAVGRGGGGERRVERAADGIGRPYGAGADPAIKGGERDHELRLGGRGHCME